MVPSMTHPEKSTDSSSPHTRLMDALIFFSKRSISWRLASTMACSASISWVEIKDEESALNDLQDVWG